MAAKVMDTGKECVAETAEAGALIRLLMLAVLMMVFVEKRRRMQKR